MAKVLFIAAIVLFSITLAGVAVTQPFLGLLLVHPLNDSAITAYSVDLNLTTDKDAVCSYRLCKSTDVYSKESVSGEAWLWLIAMQDFLYGSLILLF